MTLKQTVMVFSSCIVFVGVIMIIGTKLKCKILVDPPEEWSSFYSHSAFKKMFGSDFLIYFNYLFGVLLIVMGIFAFFMALFGTVTYKTYN